ncbi:MAG: ribonuclease R [Coriobacteriaceae bacterium]|nr:ribonuclease R [Coriobacteriaceae bacterium]
MARSFHRGCSLQARTSSTPSILAPGPTPVAPLPRAWSAVRRKCATVDVGRRRPGDRGGGLRLEKEVLKALKRADTPLGAEQVAAQAGVDAGRAETVLRGLVRSGSALRTQDGRYLALRQRGVVVGRLSITRRGYGFVASPGGDVYVRARDLGGAMHGDTVAARLDAKRGREGLSGVVVQVTERANSTIVGRFEKHGKVGIVVPTDPRIRHDVFVPVKPDGPRTGEYVVARISRYPTAHEAAQGDVIEVLGDEKTPGVQVEIVIREHGLRTGFPAEAEAEAAALRLDVEHALAERGREDVRGRFTVTIDPVDAKDFDDAITLERRSGGWLLGVHIADVSHYVPWGSEVDREARLRATSVYLVDRVLPMLPEALSNGLCSLKPDEERVSFSVDLEIDRNGAVLAARAYPSVMRSDRRLDYDEVDVWLGSGEGFPDEQTAELLTEFRTVAAKLGERRVARGGLDFETVEAKVRLAEDGSPIEVVLRKRTPATDMIEEAMIAANEAVARHMRNAEAPMVYRIHEDPDPDALDQVAAILKEFDYPVKDIHGAEPRTFQRIVAFAHGRDEELLINSLLLRALERARYVDYLGSHFGLASDAYTHFTSPIRRYPDLIVHRLLRAQLTGRLDAEPTAAMVPELGWLAEHCSAMEREAEAAENDSTQVKLCELMERHVGEDFDGIITGVQTFGLFVQLANTAEGLVHVSAMAGDYYRFDAERHLLLGENSGTQYRLGGRVRVRIASVSVVERRIDLELA